MKKFQLLSILGIVLFAGCLAWCTKNATDNQNSWDIIIEDIEIEDNPVIEYNDNLVDLAYSCISSEDNIWNRFDDEEASTESIQEAIDDTISKCTSVIEDIDNLWDWEWDSSLKDAAIVTIEKDIAYFDKLSELLPYTEKEDLTDEENATYEALFDEIETLDSELLLANENLAAVQEEFAKNHWFELESEDIAEAE